MLSGPKRAQQFAHFGSCQVFPYPGCLCAPDHTVSQALRRDSQYGDKGQLIEQSPGNCGRSPSNWPWSAPNQFSTSALSPHFHHAVPRTQQPWRHPGEHQLPSTNSLLQHATHSEAGQGSRICICLAGNCLPSRILGPNLGPNEWAEGMAHVFPAVSRPLQVLVPFPSERRIG